MRRSAVGRGARTYVELDGVELGGVARETALGGIVSRIVAEATTTGSRVALDLNGPAYRRVFHLLEPYRVVIDIARQPPGSGPTGKGRSVARVVLDPGHGGNDPGATGPDRPQGEGRHARDRAQGGAGARALRASRSR